MSAENEAKTRRDLLGTASLSVFGAAVCGAVVGIARLPAPAVLPGPSRRVKLGTPDEVPSGGPHRPEGQSFALFRDTEGIYAVSMICTHLGCVVGTAEVGFRCPCHGSEFAADGAVIHGPAPRGLPWLRVSLTEDGALEVDQDAEVPAGTRLQV